MSTNQIMDLCTSVDACQTDAAGADRRLFQTENFCVEKNLLESFQSGLFCDVELIANDGSR